MELIQFVVNFTCENNTIVAGGGIAFIVGVILIQLFGGDSMVGFVDDNLFTNIGGILVVEGIGAVAFFFFIMVLTNAGVEELNSFQTVVIACATTLFMGWVLLGFTGLIIEVWESIKRITQN